MCADGTPRGLETQLWREGLRTALDQTFAPPNSDRHFLSRPKVTARSGSHFQCTQSSLKVLENCHTKGRCTNPLSSELRIPKELLY